MIWVMETNNYEIRRWYAIEDNFGVVQIVPPPPPEVLTKIAAALHAQGKAIVDYAMLGNPDLDALEINIRTEDPRIIETIANAAFEGILDYCTDQEAAAIG